MTRRQRRLLTAVGSALLMIAATAFAPWPVWLFYNPSDSALHGWYVQHPLRAIRPGTPVFAQLPADVAQFAHQRGYLPQHLPILKRVGAVGGQHVCVRRGLVHIDGRAIALTRARDGAGRPLAAWNGCRMLAPGEVFLFAAGSAASFDSRYFGPVGISALRGEAVRLWTW